MAFYGIFGYLSILKESANLLPRNWRLITFLTVLYVLLLWILSSSLVFSVLSLTKQIVTAQQQLVPKFSSFTASDPRSYAASANSVQDQLDHIKQITVTIFALELAFVLVVYFVAFFFTIATVFISAVSLTGSTVSAKEVVSRIAKTWTRPLVTSIYVSMQSMGFFVLVGLLVAPAIIYPKLLTISVAALAAIAGLLVYVYLATIWGLALVASVVEESSCCGMVAMGKASTVLVKGQRLNGYMLNLFFLGVGLIIALLLQILVPRWSTKSGVFMLILVAFSGAMKVLAVTAYTVLYFRCKEEKGEEIRVYDHGMKYEILPTIQPMK